MRSFGRKLRYASFAPHSFNVSVRSHRAFLGVVACGFSQVSAFRAVYVSAAAVVGCGVSFRRVCASA